MGVIFTGSRHSIRPSLNLDFANSKTLDPRITFTRASSGVYYDGYSSVKAEENLFKYSQEFDNAYWDKVRTDLTANNTTAPDGTTTAEKLAQASGETIGGAVYKNGFIFVNSSYYTLSIFAKAGTNRNFVGLRENVSGGNNTTWFNLSTGAVGTTDANHTASISDAGNGWYRCSITFLTTTTSGNPTYYVYETDNSTTVTDNQGFIYIWGAQLEQRDSLTAYTTTTSSPITKYQPQLQTAQSNVARFDHNPTTGESLGLLIEEQRTNKITRSEEFDNAYWSKVNYTVEANQTIAPDGTLSADLLILDDGVSAGVTKAITRGSLTTSGTSAFSIYIKNFGCTGTFTLQDGSGNGVTFNLENNTKSNFGSFLSSPVAEDVGNNWYRLKFATSTTNNTFYMYQGSFTGNGHNGVFLWGAQFEEASFPTSYIKTTGSQVTRSADNPTIEDISDWFNNGEGTLYGEAFVPSSNLRANLGLISLATTTSVNPKNRIEIRYSGNSNQSRGTIRTNSLDYANFYIDADTENRKVALAYKTNDASMSANGTGTSTDTSILISPEIYKATIGYIGAYQTVGGLNGYIKKISYYPTRLTNDEITDLSEA